MSVSVDDENETRMVGAVVSMVERSLGTLAKLPIVAFMIGCGAYAIDGASFWKCLLVGCMISGLTIFRTWRRIIELLALPVFLLACLVFTSSVARQFLADALHSLIR